jgi:hypothetical protein
MLIARIAENKKATYSGGCWFRFFSFMSLDFWDSGDFRSFERLLGSRQIPSTKYREFG